MQNVGLLQPLDVEGDVAEQAVDLLDAMLGLGAGKRRVGGTDGMDRGLDGVGRTGQGVAEGDDALGVEVVASWVKARK